MVGYVANQVHRMDYPTYVSKGWAIGSGPVESACRTVTGKRMKGGGMRWGEAGADEMSHLRALFASGDESEGEPWFPDRCHVVHSDDTGMAESFATETRGQRIGAERHAAEFDLLGDESIPFRVPRCSAAPGSASSSTARC